MEAEPTPLQVRKFLVDHPDFLRAFLLQESRRDPAWLREFLAREERIRGAHR